MAQHAFIPSKDSLIVRLNNRALSLLYSRLDSSILYSRQALDRAQQLNDTAGQAKALNNLGKACYIKGSYEQSLKFSTRALALAERINDRQNMVIAYNDIGLAYMGHDQYDLALNEFLRSIGIATSIHDSADLASPLFNAGICYEHNEEFKKALQYFDQANQTDKGQHVSLMSVNRLGETWFHLKKYDTAIRYYRQVLADPRVKEDNWEKAFAYAGLAEVSYIRQQYDSALSYAGQSFSFAKVIDAKWDAERAARIMADSYAALHQYQKAYEYMVIDHLYNDSLYNDSREQVLNFMKLQQEEKENRQLQTQSDQDKALIRLRTFLLVGALLLAALLVGIALIIYRNYTIKNRLNQQLALQNVDMLRQKDQIDRQNEALTTSNQLKDQLFSVISHDLRSPMAAIQQMLEFIKSKNLPAAEKERMYDLFYRQVIVSNNMLNNLLQWVTAQLSGTGIVAKKEPVDPSRVAGEVLSVYTFLAEQKKIYIDNGLPDGLSISADKEQLKIIFQNIIGNAVKFTNPGGAIRLFHSCHDRTLTLHIKDNGVGISAERLATLFDTSGPSFSTYGTAREKGTGIGLFLVRQFVEQNDGQLWVHSEEGVGTETRISFTSIQGN